MQGPYKCGIHTDDESLDLTSEQIASRCTPVTIFSIVYFVHSLTLCWCLEYTRWRCIWNGMHACKINSRLHAHAACYHIRSIFLSSHLLP